ncbi:uncharacterized protein LOC126983220 isoform X2 [Eriocheir sinensis]|nr:uncharacterized protein LOC126983220 isoform X2 [Eriocheir sinensis]XP_050691803.1 uncharacterized protein LOC126983220 isoform X2 [Eriocheir sinensis]XP_050691804.1 uncharacterized protein LOC126983220 isoform X2 [Eriocheir sinensis]XP_050691805.1 uncharacterized protein LOC126983220 isoform X2 [Eriocheir sinensis]XP_050691806.1 uncharacterized protein LOC126983220 isoform X2 [Eriocheir sinensis]
MDDIEGGLLEARECFREGRYEHAKTLYTSALDTLHTLPLPQNDGEKLAAMIYNERGLCQYKMVCFDEAVEDYTNAVRLNPSLAAAYYSRATINYRLLAGYLHGSSEREALGRKAVDDFKTAVTLDPSNIDFREGLRSCLDEVQGGLGDDNVCVLNLENVPLATLVKLLFLLDTGDQGPGTTTYRREARQAKEIFLAILRSKEQGHQQIVSVLQSRAKDLQEFQSSRLPVNAEAASLYCVRKEEEDLLVLVKCCDHLGVEYHRLEDKIKQVQDKMELEENEKEGNFFINAENLLMSDICDSLTPELVYKLFCLAASRDGWKFWEGGDARVVQKEQLTEDGVKEALFFFIIRQMEERMLLNRIYTDKLEGLLKELCEDNPQNEVLNATIQKLKNYPDECQPPGLCLIFCVKERREGSDIEITKLKSVFGDLFKFTVKIEEDPNQSTLERYHKKELLKAKYKFYDSLVIWFVSHGDEKNLLLPGEEKYDRESFIDDFSRVSTFNMKPKIFFMGTCRGNTPIPINNLGGRKGDVDGCSIWQDGLGSNRGRVNVSLSNQDISNIYYQMDRIVSYATLPSHTAFRVKDEGSVFVDTVCAQLEESQDQNITQVLEAVCQVIHQIVFCIEEREDLGNTKQACFYESTFQKTYLVPRMKADLT